VHPVYFRGGIVLLNLYAFDASDPFKASEASLRRPTAPSSLSSGMPATRRRRQAMNPPGCLVVELQIQGGWRQAGRHGLVDENGKFVLLARDGACNLVAVGADKAVLHRLMDQALSETSH